MSAPIALTCPYCGAPLPSIAPQQTIATCAYCGATASLSGAMAVRAEPPKGMLVGGPTNDPALLVRVVQTFAEAQQRGDSSFEALVAASRERLGPLGETESFARVCLGLAEDFDRENGTKAASDPMSVGRMIEVYLKAIEGLRTSGSYVADIPFFAANAQGPRHFKRTLTPEVIAALASRPPPAKKKGFWPFG